ncbi:MAG: hypothetical protein OZ921_09275 [Sorangiineae bacterium]|nr:hypothetical protein [Polyangiaceae bacterium]MEB2322694.1 hypothetical protein [Sorangiineae bacterium]
MSAPLPEAAPPLASGSGSAPPAAPRAFAAVKAILAPKRAARWTLGASELTAPPGRVFERAVSMDLDGDGKLDVVSWTLPVSPASPTTSPGELWFHPGGGGAPRRVASLPGFVPTGPGCALTAELTGTGPRTVTLDARADCQGTRIARAPVRALMVVAPGSAERPVAFELRAAAPAADETLELGVDSSDRDGDGRDDVDLTIRVGRARSGNPAAAHLVWLDRAAGASRESDEPLASFERLSAAALTVSRQKSGSAAVPERVANIRRLMFALCGESGVSRLFDRDGATLPCGPLGTSLDRLALAEAQAAAQRGDARELGAVLARDGFYLAPMSPKTRKSVAGLFEKAAPRLAAAEVTTLTVQVAAEGATPRWSPLSFDDDGSLLVDTPRGLVRVGADDAERDEDPEGGVTGWPEAVASEGGVRWIAVTYPCEKSEVELVLVGGASAPVPPISTGVLAPRPGKCGRAPFEVTLPRAPIAWTSAGLEAFVAGSVVGARANPAAATMRGGAPGSPRSPDGRLLATPSVGGVLVTGGPKPALWTGRGLDAKTLSGCTISNGGARLACVDGTRVLVARHP